MQKLLEVVEIWSALSLATFAFILWYRSQPNRHRQWPAAHRGRFSPQTQ